MKSITKIALASAAVSVFAASASAAPAFKAGGDIQFRLREETVMTLDSAGDYYADSKYSEFSNKYMWNFKLGVDVNENLALKFRLSNPNGSNLETVGSNENFMDDFENKIVAIPQAEMQYKIGFFALSAGIIEVKNNTTLNLVRSAEEQGYTKSLDISNDWATWTNNSQTGLKFSFDAGEMIDVNVTTAIAEYAKTTDDSDHYVNLRAILDVPVTFGENGKFKVIPTVAVRSGISGMYTGRNYSTNGGIDFAGKFSDLFSLQAGAAYGMFRNSDHNSDADITAGNGWEKPSGLLLTAKPTFKFGFNKVTVGYSFGRSEDLNAEGDNDYAKTFQHIDAKWGFAVAKGFTVMPRFRTWFSGDTKDGSDTKVKLRPELIFTAKF